MWGLPACQWLQVRHAAFSSRLILLLCLIITEEVTSDLPASREQRVEQKRFYFDVGSNARGVYLRISEVRF